LVGSIILGFKKVYFRAILSYSYDIKPKKI